VSILQKYIHEFRDGKDLAPADAELFLDALIIETDEKVLDGIFRSWNEKGITADEIYEIARLMRERCTKVATKHDVFVDIVGTGGARNKTFNVSTAAAFVVAGAGVTVAKHGNKAATSNSGSADVLSALGIEPAVDASTAELCLNEIGLCFMFAPNFHRLSPTLAKVRRGLGFPTIFNCVGPLCNPANAPHQLIGVWDRDLVPKMAEALSRLGTGKSWVVHGRDGIDEIALTGETCVAEIDGVGVTRFEISPREFGLENESSRGPKISSPEESADLIRGVLDGRLSETSAERVVLANAAAAIYIANGVKNLRDGFEAAAESLRNGSAKKKMVRLAELTKR
jgi:anthranilate phosphoribosyltransferase